MKYKIEKTESNDFVMSVLINANGEPLTPAKEFSYPEFINFLYFNKGAKIDFEFVGMSEEEKDKINKFMEEVYKIFSEKKDN